jgi:hypothetical protein
LMATLMYVILHTKDDVWPNRCDERR